MNRTLVIFSLLAVIITNIAYAGEYHGEYSGAWVLRKIVSVATTDQKPLLKIGNVINVMSSEVTIWDHNIKKNEDIDSIQYCHAGGVNANLFSFNKPTHDFNDFIQSAGGMYKFNTMLKNKFNVTLSNINLAWGFEKNNDSKEPCNHIWVNSDNTSKMIYLSKDKKTTFMFIFPYIYYFKGAWGTPGT